MVSQHNNTIEPRGLIAAIDPNEEFIVSPTKAILAHQRVIKGENNRLSNAIQNSLEPCCSTDKVTPLGKRLLLRIMLG